MNHFDGLRLPEDKLAERCKGEADWEQVEQGKEHRIQVLRALIEAMHDTLVARYVDYADGGVHPDKDPQFQAHFWDPMWDGLRDSLTRQDLLRWLMDWAQRQAQDRALGTIERMHNELSMLDDDSGAWWLTQNPG